MKEMNPFTPGRPVDVEYFVGRVREVNRLQRAVAQAAKGRNENVFLTGERGMGKSSLARFTRFLAEREHNFSGVHCYLGKARTLEDICQSILRHIIEDVRERSLIEQMKGMLSRYVKDVRFDIFGIGVEVEFVRDQAELRALPLDFLPMLRRIFGLLEKAGRAGMFLILDDLNGSARVPEFAHFLKSTVDEMATSREGPLPLVVVLAGVEERMVEMGRHQPSLPRIFDVVKLDPMDFEECVEFYTKAFGAAGVSVEPAALRSLATFAGGIPAFLHEIGDAAYWLDTDGVIDKREASRAVIEAADRIGRKYLEPRVLEAIRSEAYQSILGKLANSLPVTFRRSEVLAILSGKEPAAFDNFLTRMQQLGVISKGPARGQWHFVNPLYQVYLMLGTRRGGKAGNR